MSDPATPGDAPTPPGKPSPSPGGEPPRAASDPAPERWERARRLFADARALEPDRRAAFLEASCGDDDALLEEVRSLLDADGAADGGLLDRLVARFTSVVELLEDAPPARVGPYEILEEAGRGGMGIVYRARDPRLRRDVALKFLPRSLVAEPTARARFIQEARAASALDHAGICTIHDIGESDDGRLYIAMAWYGGGTLADRLRHGPLPVNDAARIALDVADALDSAHRAGIVHRDVKPANIAFGEGDRTKVLDFGVAALETGAEPAPPIAGTPRYMAPEQVKGGPVDRRADIWALGAVLYEMVVGAPAFGGEDRRTVLPAITRGDPAALDWSRFPPRLATVLRRALAPDPDDRWSTAAEFGGAVRDAVVERPARRLAPRFAAGTGIAALALIGVVLVRARSPAAGDGGSAPGAGELDPGVVAVLPFRVSGDESLGYLREGMADLLAAKLTGEGGLRAVDPRVVYGALRARAAGGGVGAGVASGENGAPGADATRALARRVAAGKVLLGEVVGTPERLVIQARLLDRRGRVVGRAAAQGPSPALTELVDTLVAQLLTQSAGEPPQRLASLTTTSLPALRAFLEGQAAYRRGRYEEALRHYGRALEADSTFALAGLGLQLAGGWTGGMESTRALGREVAWRHRERLSHADRALLSASVGPAYPRPSSVRETLGAIEDGLRLAPDRVELWYMQADAYLHHGGVMGVADWEERAEAGFRRALELDSTFAAPLHHLALLHARRGKLDRMDAAVAAFLAREPAGSTADFLRWRRAAAHGEMRGGMRFDSLSVEALGWIAMIAQDEGIAIEDGRRAVEERVGRAGTGAERLERVLALRSFALNGGRPREALGLMERLREGQPDRDYTRRLRILDALWADGDSAAAARAARELVETGRDGGGDGQANGYRERLNRCVLEQWRLVGGGAGGAEPARAPDPGAPPPLAGSDGDPDDVLLCEAAAAALREASSPESRPGPALARLDSLFDGGPFDLPVGYGTIEHANRALARAWELAGEPSLALEALDRRVYFLGWQAGLAVTLREEARLATSLGDTARALRAAEHYLALRHAPEAERAPDVERMRALRERLRPAM